jgi:hypothetical protein
VLVVAGMCLLTRCLVMGIHVAIFKEKHLAKKKEKNFEALI